MISLFLDSGAFSAYAQDITIDVHEYIDFIKENLDHIEVYANLDVIGNVVATWKNQEIMEKAGLNPLPVFHLGDHDKGMKYLHRCCEYDYFCLGGMAGQAASKPQVRQAFLDECWRIIVDKEGWPKAKVHGFGVTSLKLMLRYPWYSVDSTSWVITSRMGAIFVPRFKGGQYIYDQNTWKITVSSKSPTKKNKDQHIETLSPKVRQVILDYFEHKGFALGESEFKTVKPDYKLAENEKWFDTIKERKEKGYGEVEVIIEDGLCNNYRLRDELNVIYFVDLEDSMPEYPWPFKISKQMTGLDI